MSEHARRRVLFRGPIESATLDFAKREAKQLRIDTKSSRYVGAPAANTAAMFDRCRKDAKRSEENAGVAMGLETLLHLDHPTPGKTLGHKIATALRNARNGRCREATGRLYYGLSALENGEQIPMWRSTTASPTRSKINLGTRRVVTFDNGRYTAHRLDTGTSDWAKYFGVAEPSIERSKGNGRFIATEKALLFIGRGGQQRFSLRLKAPHREWVEDNNNHLYVAGSQELVSVSNKGKIRFRYDPLGTIPGGPVLSEEGIALASGTEIHLLTINGKLKKKIGLGDEISAPLSIDARGNVVAYVGSEQLVWWNPKTGKVKRRLHGLKGLDTPPVHIDQMSIFVGRTTRQKPFALLVTPYKKRAIARRLSGGHSVRRVGHQHFVLVEGTRSVVLRNNLGNRVWSRRFADDVLKLESTENSVVVAAGNALSEFDRATGRRIRHLSVDDKVLDFSLSPTDTLVLTEKGVSYGATGPKSSALAQIKREMKLGLGQCHLLERRLGSARQIAEQILEAAPWHVEARALLAKSSVRTAPKTSFSNWLALLKASPKTTLWPKMREQVSPPPWVRS